MAENTTRQTDHFREQNVKKGSAIFFRLPPTFMITELITFLFYPAFFSVVGNMWLPNVAGQIAGFGTGVILAIVAISFRRWGYRWAVRHTEKRENQAANNALDEAGEIAPHVNFLHLSDIFYFFMEVAVISCIAAYFLNGLHQEQPSEFASFYNQYAFIIDLIFTHYHGLDYEISMHLGTTYEYRVVFMKATASISICAALYGIVIATVRLFIGWRRYVVYIRRVKNQVTLKNEKKALLGFITLGPFVLLGVDALYWNGIEFFIIVDKLTDAGWYMYVVSYKYILYTSGMIIMIFMPLSFLISFLVLVYVHKSSQSNSIGNEG